MKKLSLIVALLFYFTGVFAQQPAAIEQTAVEERTGKISKLNRLASTITVDDLTRHLTILSSDEFEGRETGTEGEKKARTYIADVFKSYGLPPVGQGDSYFQPFSYITENWEDISLKINGEKFDHLKKYFSLPAKNSDLEFSTDEIIFLGYGIEDAKYSDYKGRNVKGKILLVFDGEPVKNNTYLISKSNTPSEWTSDRNRKIKAAKKNGARAVFFIADKFKEQKRNVRQQIVGRRKHMGWSENPEANYANSVVITEELAQKLAGSDYQKMKKLLKKIDKKGKSRSLKLTSNIELRQKKTVNQLLGNNVIGFIEGSDENLKNEYVFLTAHYDHIGKRGGDIYNGADDNGSGTSSLLEIAQAFSEAKKNGWGPRRSVVVMLVSGEEKGLLGSKYYVENPIFPLENTIVDINVDMVGRVDEKHADDANYIYVIGADRLSSELHLINEAANERYTHLELDYTFNEESDPNRYYYRSDHYNFAEKGIPSVFFFNGTHEDYHRASDTIEKINFEKMNKIAQLIFYTAWELANRDERIKVDKK